MTSFDLGSSMRLFRRSLLCLVVGVTAFGVAGWRLRPRPVWTVEIPKGSGLSLMRGEADISSEDWIWVVRPDPNQDARAELSAFDARSGERTRSIGLSEGYDGLDVRRRENLVVVNERPSYRAPPFSPTKISLYDAKNGTLLRSKAFEGRAELCADGRTAWCVKVVGRSLSLRVVDLETDQVVCALDFADGFKGASESNVAVSSDAKRFAFLKPIHGDADDNPTIELWNVETKSRLRSILPDARGDRILQVTDPQFTDDGGLKYRARVRGPHRGSSEERLFDLNSGRHVAPPSDPEESLIKPEPFEDDERFEVSLHHSQGGWEIWTAFDWEQRAGAFGVFRNGEPIQPWRRVPFSIQMPPFVWFVEPLEKESDPPRRWLVHLWEPSLRDSLPTTIQNWAPASLQINDVRPRLYWYDADRNDWRWIGTNCRGDDYCLRVGSVVTLDETSKEVHSLRRWPLPPRDPKWPALGIAAACMAGTWWACATRYKRRKRLASVGAG
jgi:hypothetical protein